MTRSGREPRGFSGASLDRLSRPTSQVYSDELHWKMHKEVFVEDYLDE